MLPFDQQKEAVALMTLHKMQQEFLWGDQWHRIEDVTEDAEHGHVQFTLVVVKIKVAAGLDQVGSLPVLRVGECTSPLCGTGFSPVLAEDVA